MTVIAIVGNGLIQGSLFDPDSGAATYNNLTSAPALLNVELLIWSVILILDIVVAWGLYVYFSDENREVALLSGWFRLIYAGMLGAAMLCLVLIAQTINSASFLSAYTVQQISAQIMLYSDSFKNLSEIGMIVFGLHLLSIGILALKTGYVPKWLSILVCIAAFGYIVLHLMYAFMPQFDSVTDIVQMIMMIPMILGELLLAIWLLIKGKNIEIKA